MASGRVHESSSEQKRGQAVQIPFREVQMPECLLQLRSIAAVADVLLPLPGNGSSIIQRGGCSGLGLPLNIRTKRDPFLEGPQSQGLADAGQ